MRDDRRRDGVPDFEVVACIDGRGFGVRREDMRTLIFQNGRQGVHASHTGSDGRLYTASRILARRGGTLELSTSTPRRQTPAFRRWRNY